MADSIIRLVVNSSEYDNKLKRAAEGLTRYADQCRKAGGTLEYVDEGVMEFTRSLGKMDTTATTAKGKLNEMTKAFTDLSVQYKQMTDEEKKSPFGQALGQSLNELKGRIGESKAQLNEVSQSLNGNSGLSGALDSIAEKFGMSITQLTGFGTAIAAVGGALEVAKDAFFASEDNIDEWGRTVEVGKSLYEGFLVALNTGDISGYLNNINTITQAARDAYNELDRLSTQKAINNSKMTAQQTENERFRAMLRTGRYIAPNDGRKATMAEGTVLSKATMDRIARMLENGMKTTNSIVRSEIDQTTKAINALYREQASRLNMSYKEFRAGTSSMEELDKRMAGYNQYQQWRAAHTTIDQQSGREIVARGNPYAKYASWGVFKDDGELFQSIQNLISQRAGLQSQNYSNIAQAYKSINKVLGSGGGKGGSRGGGDEFDISKIAFMAGEGEKFDPDRNWVSGFALMTEEAKKQMLGLNDAVEDLGDSLAKIGEKAVLQEVNDAIAKQKEAVDKTKKAWSDTGQAIGMVGNMMGSIKNPAAQTAGAVAQAIANIALAYSQALGEDGTIKSNIWYFIAATAAAMVSMATTISQIHSATGYAQGGIVEGNSYSGDNMMFGGDGLYGLNSGELVLTKAQQGNLASQLSGGAQNLQLDGVISGEKIHIVHNRYLKRTGQGELLTWG